MDVSVDDAPDINIDDEIGMEEMYHNEYMDYEENMFDMDMIEEEGPSDQSATQQPEIPLTPTQSSDSVSKSPDRTSLHSTSASISSVVRSATKNRHFSPSSTRVSTRGPQLKALLTSASLTTQDPPYTMHDASSYLKDRPPLGMEHVTITLADGTRKYVVRREARDCNTTAPSSGHLLSQSMAEVSREAENRKILKLAEMNAMEESKANMASIAVIDGKTGDHKSLWVDKYAPRSFSQLLSQEKTNREVLRAVKLWDKHVFGIDTEHLQPQHGGGRDKQEKKDQKGADGQDIHEYFSTDQRDKRPYHKVILLTGPPGTGKTTLAHIVASHCGYRPVEMNASDDRSVDALRDVISRSMGNTTLDSLTGGEGTLENRPNCVILDEIDGMDGRAPIDALVNIIKTPLYQSTGTGKKKSGKGRIVLTRPVICICNDQFAPMLRELRAIAKVFVFGPPSETRLVQRLKHVCAAEGLHHVSPTALSSLCHASGSDIRSAINTLQFAALRVAMERNRSRSKDPRLTADTSYDFSRLLNSMLLGGLKDERQDVFQLWRKIFSSKNLSDTGMKRLAALISSQPGTEIDVDAYRTSRPSQAMDVFDSVMGFGDNQLVMMGVFENFLSVRYTDPTFQRTATASDWLSWGDVLEGKQFSGDSGSQYMTVYVPAVASVVHMVCSTDSPGQKLSFPSKDRSVWFTKQQKENILKHFFEGAVLGSSVVHSKHASAVDVIPLLLDTMSLSGTINVRPGPMQMLSGPEKDRVNSVAKIMVACGLQYERSQTSSKTSYGPSRNKDDGMFQLVPAINQLVSYSAEYELEHRRRPIPSELRHNLYLEVRGILLEALLNKSRGESGDIEGEHELEGGQSSPSTNKREPPQSSEVVVEADTSVSEQIISGPPTKKAKLNAMGFFRKGGKGTSQSKGSTSDAKAKALAVAKAARNDVVRFKFNQGFSNAVKRPVNISEFMRK